MKTFISFFRSFAIYLCVSDRFEKNSVNTKRKERNKNLFKPKMTYDYFQNIVLKKWNSKN